MDSDGNSSSNEKKSITTLPFLSNKDEISLSNWTQEEKFQLLEALKQFTNDETDKIACILQTKTKVEVNEAIQFYRKVMLRHPHIAQKKKKHRNEVKYFPTAPLLGWASNLTDKLDTEELYTETLEAVRMICALERIPPPECTGDIDLTKIYELIADAIEGRPLGLVDNQIVAIIYKCLIETILTSKTYMRNSAVSRLANDIIDGDVDTIIRPNDSPELTILRSILSQRKFNPFGIDADQLTLSK